MQQRVKTSACIITYNHVAFIEECLIGAINQSVDFDYEIVIGDDCSTDGTSEICERYAEQYPDLIRYNRRQRNLGMHGNVIQTLKECKGEYIALCEGDDYWTDDMKLQIQVQYLEDYNDFSICFHKASILNYGKLEDDYLNVKTPEVTEIINLINGNYIRTCTCMIRSEIVEDLPATILHSPVMDYVISLTAAKQGKIKFFDITMAIYRVHDGGVWESKDLSYRRENFLKTRLLLLGQFNDDVEKLNRRKIVQEIMLLRGNLSIHEGPSNSTYNLLIELDKEIDKSNAMDYRIGYLILWPLRKMKTLFR